MDAIEDGERFFIMPQKDRGESKESHVERSQLIIKLLKNGTSFSRAEILSRIHRNIKQLKCTYPQEIMDEIANV